jgi:hypothetical protein
MSWPCRWGLLATTSWMERERGNVWYWLHQLNWIKLIEQWTNNLTNSMVPWTVDIYSFSKHNYLLSHNKSFNHNSYKKPLPETILTLSFHFSWQDVFSGSMLILSLNQRRDILCRLIFRHSEPKLCMNLVFPHACYISCSSQLSFLQALEGHTLLTKFTTFTIFLRNLFLGPNIVHKTSKRRLIFVCPLVTDFVSHINNRENYMLSYILVV